MPRRLSERMLKRKVSRWGPIYRNHIVVVFQDGKIALVNPLDETYSSVRAWNPWVREQYHRAASIRADGATLAEVLAIAKARVMQP
ncbi:MAG: hypothetical protein GSR84_04630 [Desulfurococcales archaeon]|nr:hypothetical protein [Desulfurococcales archaeon]